MGATPSPDEPVLRVRDLRVTFPRAGGVTTAVDGVSFDLFRGKTLAVVGESGSGKTVTGLALLGLVEHPGRVADGSVCYRGQEIVDAPPARLQSIRGQHIAMIFQEPMTALNPVMTIGDQVAEPLRLHRKLSARAAREAATGLLSDVGIADADNRYDSYPHELSGGMRQRVVVAMALACEPDVVVADEPTTALDVTIQAQILALLRRLQSERNTAVLFITHDLALVETMADDVAVMYAGRLVERSSVGELTRAPRHPYTRGLWRANPALTPPGDPLQPIAGTVPRLDALPPGCAFAPRCPRAESKCSQTKPRFEDGVACHFPHDESSAATDDRGEA